MFGGVGLASACEGMTTKRTRKAVQLWGLGSGVGVRLAASRVCFAIKSLPPCGRVGNLGGRRVGLVLGANEVST